MHRHHLTRPLAVVAAASAATLVSQLGLAPSAAALGLDAPAAATTYDLTPERAVASVSVIVALVGVGLGTAARLLSRHPNRGRALHTSARAACGAGLVALLSGGLVVATADGGLGTGHGFAGGIAAMTLGLLALTLGGSAITRSRTSTTDAAEAPPGR